MFAQACQAVRESVYGVIGISQIGPNQVNATNATAFAIAPGVLTTAAHFCHVESDSAKPVHTRFEAIRAPDIGQPTEQAIFVAEDTVRDIALLRITNPGSPVCVTLHTARVKIGTSCGSLGFPLAVVQFLQTSRMFNLTERFQGASVSAFYTEIHPSGRQLDYYETDALMYSGSSGCPSFLTDGRVFAMHVASVVAAPRTAPSGAAPATDVSARLAISKWVPASYIAGFAQANGVAI